MQRELVGGWNFYSAVGKLNTGLRRTNPDSGMVEDLNQGPPDFKSSTLKQSAMPSQQKVVTKL